MIKHNLSYFVSLTVADPECSRGGRQLPKGCTNLLFRKKVPKRIFRWLWARVPAARLDPPLLDILRKCTHLNTDRQFACSCLCTYKSRLCTVGSDHTGHQRQGSHLKVIPDCHVIASSGPLDLYAIPHNI